MAVLSSTIQNKPELKQPKCPSPDESINENMNEHLSHFLEVQSLSLAFEAIVLMSLIKPHLYVFYSAATF